VAATGSNRRKKKFLVSKQPQQQQQSGPVWAHPPWGRPGCLAPRTSMCFYHTKFGEQAKYCQEGCLWLEN
jgi:hypothetical protein